MQIKISEIKVLHERLREINSIPIKDIEFINDDGSVISINPKILDTWLFIGLNNTDFIAYDYYLGIDIIKE